MFEELVNKTIQNLNATPPKLKDNFEYNMTKELSTKWRIFYLFILCLYPQLYVQVYIQSYHKLHFIRITIYIIAFNIRRHIDDDIHSPSYYNVAKNIYLGYCPLRTTFVKRTLYEVFRAFYEQVSFHKQTVDRCAHHCLLGNKDSYRHYSKEDSKNGSY